MVSDNESPDQEDDEGIQMLMAALREALKGVSPESDASTREDKDEPQEEDDGAKS